MKVFKVIYTISGGRSRHKYYQTEAGVRQFVQKLTGEYEVYKYDNTKECYKLYGTK